MALIRSGLEKYGTALVPVKGRDGKQPFGIDRPARTVTIRVPTDVVVFPSFIAELRGGGSKHHPVAEPLAREPPRPGRARPAGRGLRLPHAPGEGVCRRDGVACGVESIS
ncbi:hypothetical protein [Streptomyces sp. NPDC004266]|uniref:hypothetical protein n=1 Tax=Streptomyces sp. NPDC004266 TaxID=3364693 RepID=UPI0036A2679E